MTLSNDARAHLVERAAEMLARAGAGGAGGRPPPPNAGALPPPPPPDSAPLPGPADAGTGLAAPSQLLPRIPLGRLNDAGLARRPTGAAITLVLEEIALVQHQVLRVVDDPSTRGGLASKIVLVASALPGEGKTFMSLNLAGSIAITGGRPVVLVDADGHPGSLASILGLGARPGLRDLMAAPQQRRVSELVLPTEVDGLFVLPHGPIRQGVLEAAGGGTIAAAIQRLAHSLPDHIIVLDPPPCLSTSVCSALAGIAGQVLLVVDAQRTERSEVEAALDVLEACPVLQLVLNRVRLTSNDSFGAHARYGAYDA